VSYLTKLSIAKIIQHVIKEQAWYNGGIIVKWESKSTRRKTCLGATLPATSPMWTQLGLNPGVQRVWQIPGLWIHRK